MVYFPAFGITPAPPVQPQPGTFSTAATPTAATMQDGDTVGFVIVASGGALPYSYAVSTPGWSVSSTGTVIRDTAVSYAAGGANDETVEWSVTDDSGTAVPGSTAITVLDRSTAMFGTSAALTPMQQTVQLQHSNVRYGGLTYILPKDRLMTEATYRAGPRSGTILLQPHELNFAENRLPLWPADHDPASGNALVIHNLFYDDNGRGAAGAESYGTFKLINDSPDLTINLEPRAGGLGTVTVGPGESGTITISDGDTTGFHLAITAGDPATASFVLLQTHDQFGDPTDAEARWAAGRLTDRRAVVAAHGYGRYRDMNHAKFLGSNWTNGIRFQEFGDEDDYLWGLYDQTARRYHNNPTYSYIGGYRRDLIGGTGAETVAWPLKARLQEAWEHGCVYEANLPVACLEWATEEEHIDADMIARFDYGDLVTMQDRSVLDQTDRGFGTEVLANTAIPLDTRLSLLNDYRYEHVDRFAESVAQNADLLVNNQLVVELSNETWGANSQPYGPGANYLLIRRERRLAKYGITPRVNTLPNRIENGYASAEIAFRLRKVQPGIEWRMRAPGQSDYLSGLFFDHARLGLGRNGASEVNISAALFAEGVLEFIDDVNAGRLDADDYAPIPTGDLWEWFGDYFELSVANYFNANISNAAHVGKNYSSFFHTAPFWTIDQNGDHVGSDIDALAAYLDGHGPGSDRYHEIAHARLKTFMEKPEGNGNGQSALNSCREGIQKRWAAIKAFTDVYIGTDVAFYEGGKHTTLPKEWENHPQYWSVLRPFWVWYTKSLYNGLIQACTNDEAVAAGVKGLSDFNTYGQIEATSWTIREAFGQITGPYADYVRFMPASPAVPPGATAGELGLTPHQRIGQATLDFLNAAAANDYYASDAAAVKAAQEAFEAHVSGLTGYYL